MLSIRWEEEDGKVVRSTSRCSSGRRRRRSSTPTLDAAIASSCPLPLDDPCLRNLAASHVPQQREQEAPDRVCVRAALPLRCALCSGGRPSADVLRRPARYVAGGVRPSPQPRSTSPPRYARPGLARSLLDLVRRLLTFVGRRYLSCSQLLALCASLANPPLLRPYRRPS